MLACGLVIPAAAPPSLGCDKWIASLITTAEARGCTLCTVLADLSPAERLRREVVRFALFLQTCRLQNCRGERLHALHCSYRLVACQCSYLVFDEAYGILMTLGILTDPKQTLVYQQWKQLVREARWGIFATSGHLPSEIVYRLGPNPFLLVLLYPRPLSSILIILLPFPSVLAL